MPRKKKNKYEYANIAKHIIGRECNALGDTRLAMTFTFLELEHKNDRDYLKKNVKAMLKIFEKALKELEEAKDDN